MSSSNQSAVSVSESEQPAGESDEEVVANAYLRKQHTPTRSFVEGPTIPHTPGQAIPTNIAAMVQSMGGPSEIDFIGPSNAVKDLFALPYASDVAVSVAVHNLGGHTLLLDAGVGPEDHETPANSAFVERTSDNTATNAANTNDADDEGGDTHQNPSWEVAADDRPDGGDSLSMVPLTHAEQTSALAIITNLIQKHTSGESLDDENESVDERDYRGEGQLVVTPQKAITVAPPASLTRQREREDVQGAAAEIFDSGETDQETTDSHLDFKGNGTALRMDPPEHYTSTIINPPEEPRQYVGWNFHDMNLIVGSDALVYKPEPPAHPKPPQNSDQRAPPVIGVSSSSSPSSESDPGPINRHGVFVSPEDSLTRFDGHNHTAEDTSSSQALTVRIAEGDALRDQLRRHREKVEGGTFVPDYEHERRRQQGEDDATVAKHEFTGQSPPMSYAQAVVAAPSPSLPVQTAARTDLVPSSNNQLEPTSSFAVPDLRGVELQTCIVPPPTRDSQLLQFGLAPPSPPMTSVGLGRDGPSSAIHASDSPVCTVLDAYLDNVIANVPQMALCLKEKGFIQSVKLLRTEDIPSSLMHSATLELRPELGVSVVERAPDGEPLFSPRIVDLNAKMLLSFLKANCSKDNATYLLRRNAGDTDVQLFDVTAISAQRQRKWMWWLAMMSYRFALRLGQLSRSIHAEDPDGLKRSFRSRQRSLLRNALELLDDLADMDGGRHESIRAALNEHLADTFLLTGDDDDDEADNANHNGGPLPETSPSAMNLSQPLTASSAPHPYAGISADSLNKAHKYLAEGIRLLRPLLNQGFGPERREEETRDASSAQREMGADGPPSDASMPIKSVALQLHGLHHKLINVAIRLAEHHLRTYWSSSAMQALRTAARRIGDVVRILEPLEILVVPAPSSFSSWEQPPKKGVFRLPQNTDPKAGDAEMHATMPSAYLLSLRRQYTWLWECGGLFARSFAADELWRDRGHACGDDVVSLLQDMEAAACFGAKNVSGSRESTQPLWVWSDFGRVEVDAPLSSDTDSAITLSSLVPLVAPEATWKAAKSASKGGAVELAGDREAYSRAVEEAESLLKNKGLRKRDQLRVLVAAAICYSRCVAVIQSLSSSMEGGAGDKERREAKGEEDEDNSANRPPKGTSVDTGSALRPKMMAPHANHESQGWFRPHLAFFQKRVGDACNEVAKLLLDEVRVLLVQETNSSSENNDTEKSLAASPLLDSAEFWFKEGLKHFEHCGDLRNVALLRCNLCQCCKIRSNSNVVVVSQAKTAAAATASSSARGSSSGGDSYVETCLQDGADHLQKAHAALGVRENDERTWDMVSAELAATFLVLGVRRRQSLLGGGSAPVVPLDFLRLNPGEERSIVEPMEKALEIFERLGNRHQAAATHYQLATYFSKVWTCQRDETKAREKLLGAFTHFQRARSYFHSGLRGSEPTAIILSLDLSNLYSALSSKMDALQNALNCCLETKESFSRGAVLAARELEDNEWIRKMQTLNDSVEERVMKLLLNLVKVEKEEAGSSQRYKRMYRLALADKVERSKESTTNVLEDKSEAFPVFGLLDKVEQASSS